MDKESHKRKEKSSGSKYRLDDSERKLPRPVVFWSDNEKDAFRRNKVVQTRYYMLLDDIETQQKSSEKSIRHEAHKFRRRYKADTVCTSDSSSTYGLYEVTSIPDNNIEKDKKKSDSCSESSFDSGSDSESNHGSWTEVPKKGVITNIRKANVKFSTSNDVIPTDNDRLIEKVQESTELRNQMWIRSQSAIQRRDKTAYSDGSYRVKSAIMTKTQFSTGNKSRPASCKSRSSLNSDRKTKQSVKPNSIFFDRSQAAYQLRKDLQTLAKNRKNGVVKVAYTMQDAIRDERDRLTESTKKVAEYIQKLEIDKQSRKIDEWTSKTIEPVFTV